MKHISCTFFILFSFLLFSNSTLDSDELNGFLKDFAKNKPIGYSVKHFTEKLLEEVMKLALRDTLLKSGNVNAIPNLKIVTLLDYHSLSQFFLNMNISNKLTEQDFDRMIQHSFVSNHTNASSSSLENEKNMDLFLSNLLKYISKSYMENNFKEASKKKMYFYVYLITKLKNSYMNQTSNVSLAGVLNTEKDLNLTDFIHYTLKFNASDLPFSEYFDEESLKKPEYQNKALKEWSNILHSHIKNGSNAAAIIQGEKSEGTEIWLIILIGVIGMAAFIMVLYFTKKYLKTRYTSLNNNNEAITISERTDTNVLTAKF